MLEFPEGYFEEEVRDGFTVSSMMKRAWAAQLEILQRVIDICAKHGLIYYAYWGTLLGTIRHKGFIPWDDDVDIALKREDYMRLMEIAKKELPAEYCILNCYTEEEWENSFTRITNGHTIDVSEEKLLEYHGFPFVAGIDIFPLDYIPRNMQAAQLQKTLLGLVGNMVSLLDFAEEQSALGISGGELAETVQTLDEGLAALEECFETVIDRKRNIRNQLQKIYDRVCTMYGDADGDILTSMPSYMKNDTFCFQKTWHTDTLQMPFENIMLAVPVGYDAILRRVYQDYMVPVNRKAAHDYPFYEDQLAMMADSRERITDGVDSGAADGEELKPDLREMASKTILYYVNMEQFLEQPARTVAKIKNVLKIFENNTDVRLWWRPFALNHAGDKYARMYFLKEYEEYRQLAENYKTLNLGMFDVIDSYDKAIRLSDAYYGDEGELLEKFRETGKPIMVQNYNAVEY